MRHWKLIEQLKTLKIIKRKLKNNNIHVNTDESSNGIVLINKNEYFIKTLQFTEEYDFTEIKRNPTINTKEKLNR